MFWRFEVVQYTVKSPRFKRLKLPKLSQYRITIPQCSKMQIHEVLKNNHCQLRSDYSQRISVCGI
jgi:hypothetical protein